MPKRELFKEEEDIQWAKLCQDVEERTSNMLKKKAPKKPEIARAVDFLPKAEDFEGCLGLEVVEGQEIVLKSFYFFDTQWGEAVKITAEIEGVEGVILTWSKVLNKQAHKLEDHLPLITTIVRIKKYYSFS